MKLARDFDTKAMRERDRDATPIFNALAQEMDLLVVLYRPVQNLFARVGWFNWDTSWRRDLD